mmetsp:Transcript_88491/g.228175  ORF Transcript_88491/g.228175 Transcript_88491/m.228175 type:complete len:209 (-) Transcript_88491:505-1131(-)
MMQSRHTSKRDLDAASFFCMEAERSMRRAMDLGAPLISLARLSDCGEVPSGRTSEASVGTAAGSRPSIAAASSLISAVDIAVKLLQSCAMMAQLPGFCSRRRLTISSDSSFTRRPRWYSSWTSRILVLVSAAPQLRIVSTALDESSCCWNFSMSSVKSFRLSTAIQRPRRPCRAVLPRYWIQSRLCLGICWIRRVRPPARSASASVTR